jgi:tetratricopeptide (TPR) repeat protein
MKQLSVLVFFLFLFFASIGQQRIVNTKLIDPTSVTAAKEAYNEAVNSFRSKDFKSAIQYGEVAIAADPNFGSAYTNLGLSFIQINKLDSAEYYLTIAHTKEPTNTTAILNLGVIQDLKENYEQAMSFYKQINDVEPENPFGYYGVGRMQNRLHRYDDALKNAQIAEKYFKQINSPSINGCYYLNCIIYYHLNNKLMAKKYLDLAKASGVDVDKKMEEDLDQ